MKTMKRAILRLSELLGLFNLSGLFLQRDRLQILCYHGFEIADECSFRPQLFISAGRFEERLDHLRRKGFNVLPLADAVSRLRNGTLPPNAVAITIDDGFVSTLSVATPLLRRFALPATVYVTSYYMEKRVPVFRLGMQYTFWKAGALSDATVMASLGAILPGLNTVDTAETMWALIKYGEGLSSEDDRQALLQRVATSIGVSLTPLYDRRVLSLMSVEEVKEIAGLGVDVQLHTHRHRFPSDNRELACQEINENRERLELATGLPAQHFCYPSGIFSSRQWPWLEALGIRSATTCIPGINTPKTPLYGLRRFLDSEDISPVEFRAELAGFSELLRRFKRPRGPEHSTS